MHVPVHIVIHVEVGTFSILVSEQSAKARRERERNHALINILIHRVRNAGVLNKALKLRLKMVSFHILSHAFACFLSVYGFDFIFHFIIQQNIFLYNTKMPLLPCRKKENKNVDGYERLILTVCVKKGYNQAGKMRKNRGCPSAAPTVSSHVR